MIFCTRSADGSSAAHFAARTGSLEVLKILIDSGVLLSRLKQENGKITSMSEGQSMLQLVATSGCPKKATYLIDKIMDAKHKFDKLNNPKDICQAGAFYKKRQKRECNKDENSDSARLLVLI